MFNYTDTAMKFLTREEIRSLSYREAQKQLTLLEKTYDLDKPLSAIMFKVWNDLDDITDNLLWLEDHIAEYEDPRFSTKEIEQEELDKPVIAI
jgi:hypothetical protein